VRITWLDDYFGAVTGTGNVGEGAGVGVTVVIGFTVVGSMGTGFAPVTR
jgi:hypothetical protein